MNAGKKKSLTDELFGDLLEEESTGAIDFSEASDVEEESSRDASSEQDSSQVLSFPQVDHVDGLDDDAATELLQPDPEPVIVSEVSSNEDPIQTKNEGKEGTLLGTRPQIAQSQPQSQASKSQTIKSSVGKYSPRAAQMGLGNLGAGLAQSENLKVAQRRITELELELEKLRNENIDLSVAGETMLKRSEESEARCKELENKAEISKFNFEEEIKLLKETINSLEIELNLVKERNDTMESKLSTNMQKIKVRERELENRLELVKMENSAIIRSKNEMILDLKRNIDQLKSEQDKYRSKGSELNKKIDQKDETLKRTVKTLRMALTMLEGGGLKKKHEKKD